MFLVMTPRQSERRSPPGSRPSYGARRLTHRRVTRCMKETQRFKHHPTHPPHTTLLMKSGHFCSFLCNFERFCLCSGWSGAQRCESGWGLTFNAQVCSDLSERAEGRKRLFTITCRPLKGQLTRLPAWGSRQWRKRCCGN